MSVSTIQAAINKKADQQCAADCEAANKELSHFGVGLIISSANFH